MASIVSLIKMQPHPCLPPVGGLFHEHYEVVRCIRAGGMGAVYEVVDRRTSRRRALKVLLPSLAEDSEMRARFAQEAKITANLPVDHLVEVFDAGVDEALGAPFLVMELLRGLDLGDALRRSGRLSLEEAARVVRDVAAGLEVAHAVGVVHRDLKPENVFLVDRLDRPAAVKLLDFGIAKIAALSTLSARTTRALGSPLYMAPEQIEGDGRIDARADVYALAQLAFTLLVGQAYFAGELGRGQVYGLLLRVMKGGTEPASIRAKALGVSLPPGFDAFFARGTALSPADRFESARALADSLDELCRPVAVPPPTVVNAAPVLFRRAPSGWRRVPAGLLALCVAFELARISRPPSTALPGSSAATPPVRQVPGEDSLVVPIPSMHAPAPEQPAARSAPADSARSVVAEPFAANATLAPTGALRGHRGAPSQPRRPAPVARSSGDASPRGQPQVDDPTDVR
jgi:serine/threonine-protein kinase